MCMSVIDGETYNGASVDLYACSSDNASEQWRINSNGEIVNVLSGKCIDAKDDGTSSGTALQLWTCEGTTNQLWRLE